MGAGAACPDPRVDDGQGGMMNTPQPTPSAVIELPSTYISDLSVGGEHTCVLSEGGVYCWGDNGNGSLGLGHLDSQSTPQIVPSPLPTNVTRIRARGNMTCAMTADNLAYCWGRSDTGAFGSYQSENPIPQLINVPVILPEIVDVVGYQDLCALTPNGNVYCWPDGAGTTPQQVVFDAPDDVVSLGQRLWGGGSECVIRSGGSVWCWGDNTYGQCGQLSATEDPINGTNTVPNPSPVPLPGNAIELATGSDNSWCASLDTGALWCWGQNSWGELGNGVMSDPLAEPVATSDPTPVAWLLGGLSFESTTGADFTVRATFSHDVSGFDLGDITLVSGSANFTELTTIDAATYTFKVTPLTEGDLQLKIAAGAVQDAAGHSNTASAILTHTFYFFPSPSMTFAMGQDSIAIPNLDATLFSVSFWAKRGVVSQSTWQTEGIIGSSTMGGWIIGFIGVGPVVPADALYISKRGTSYVASTGKILDTNWHFIVTTFDSGSIGSQTKFYIDGVLDSTRAYATSFNTSGQNYELGTDPDGSYGYQGALDEVVVWNKALTPTEVADMYAAGLLGIEESASNPNIWAGWHFNGGNGTHYPAFNNATYDGIRIR